MAPVLQIGRMSRSLPEVDCGVERLVQRGICARLPQGAGSDLRSSFIG